LPEFVEKEENICKNLAGTVFLKTNFVNTGTPNSINATTSVKGIVNKAEPIIQSRTVEDRFNDLVLKIKAAGTLNE
jgi:hypothetical protein